MSFRRSLSITRTAPGTIVKGFYTPGTTYTVNIKGSIQPLMSNNADIVVGVDGRRLSDYVKIYTDSEIYEMNETLDRYPDKITWKGNVYQCINCEHHQSSVISHYKAIFEKVTT